MSSSFGRSSGSQPAKEAGRPNLDDQSINLAEAVMGASPHSGSRWRRWLGWLLSAAILIVAMILVLGVLPGLWVYRAYSDRIYSNPKDIPPAPVAIVFGAAVWSDGRPSPMLADRVDAAVALYQAGKVDRILMTGDNSLPYYDEVTVMKDWAVSRGVPADRVNLDYAGFRTYDSCYRAKAVFGIEKAILVTQGYHLPRALYLANAFGIDAVGFKAGHDHYRGQDYYNLREAAALTMSWYEVNVTRPEPRFLGDPVDLEKQNLS